MPAELANLNHCAVLFLSRAATNLCWYYYTEMLLTPFCKKLYYTIHIIVLCNSVNGLAIFDWERLYTT